MMKKISLEEVILFHKKIVKQTGGSSDIRDITLVESALKNADMSFGGKDLYPSIEEKISVILYAIINNHGFIDGNKRIGVSMMLLLLEINNIKIKYKQHEIVDLGLKVASGEYDKNDILVWINKHKK
ncbi:MAG: type II toxin-antitoxin system death-on-curing family toxin [Firmicutes bacterium]|nr:type II toxin-antitoxin system death-on-curing family toxin [Bacillota bacterium]